jgi:hypothetical protein
MTDSSTPRWWDLEHTHPEGSTIFNSAAGGLVVALGIYELASLLSFNHKLFPLLAPILLIVPIYLAWCAFRIVGVIRAARAQSGTAEPLQQQKTLDSLRRYSRLVWGTCVIVWFVLVVITP